MRALIHKTVEALRIPDEGVLAQARQASASGAGHEAFLGAIEAFHAIEYRPPSHPAVWPGSLRVAAFNAERLNGPGAVRKLMDRAGAHAALITEADAGMARSGNAHTIRELAALTGAGHLFGVEFVELDLGDPDEMRRHAGERNRGGLHGNAVVSRLRLEESVLIPLEESGLWFPGRDGAQRRIGGRMALAARVSDAPHPLWLVGAHLESKTDPTDRRLQINRLLDALRIVIADEPCIIGGDFNTKALPRGEGERARILEAPERWEPLFADLKGAGFEWVGANTAFPTQRAGPSGKHNPPFGKLDWFVARGIVATNPQVIPAVGPMGKDISDHEMITVDLTF